ncbi:GNAT family N-acetyltransferase [Streptomyces alkaliterrae]|uniref:GNAT family N-acetyltransferase n=1 Tax=Streptomyces alkaliterrae TaxID=2213162 RepID=A0A5P0YNJ1_9ACTN|nr:GNAT family N-acetyltransferase [Streptomyces alkaliterrae]MBB1258166.1 GNAT family N-acetyltransferase [Streptomyces alkaliterrae]MQS01924.1 GNAT family N-acetyltransferase [Streptomyces alkaliterrae]
MEFTMSGRLEVRISPSDVGKRVSVRSLTDLGREADAAGPRFTDTVGVLTSWTAGVLHVTRRGGERVRIAEDRLVAGKVVPAAPARVRGLPAADTAELERVAARGWPAVETEPLGDWLLRAAGGFTRRANSVLALGDPGLPLDEALERVRAWYAFRALPAHIHTTVGGPDTGERLAAALADRGWRPVAHAEVWTGALAPIVDRGVDASAVRLSREADETWLARYNRSAGLGTEALRVLGGGPSVWFATVPGEEDGQGTGPGAPAAIGRVVVDGRWAGFGAVETAPHLRRRGLAAAVVAALAERATSEGAWAGYLQVETDNEAARAMYGRLGFARHHGYQHWRAPEAP